MNETAPSIMVQSWLRSKQQIRTYLKKQEKQKSGFHHNYHFLIKVPQILEEYEI